MLACEIIIGLSFHFEEVTMTNYSLQQVRHLTKSAKIVETPVLIMDREKLQENCRTFRGIFKKNKIFYSVKANCADPVIKLLDENGINFDVAAKGEIDQLLRLGIPVEKMIFSAPTKIPGHIEFAYQIGVKVFAFDSYRELDKLALHAPGSEVIARVTVSNTGSEWPLEKKFGVEPSLVVDLMIYARDKGLVPAGLGFHVGSQNLVPASWGSALESMARLSSDLKIAGVSLKYINTGGGYPADYRQEIPSVDAIAEVIHSSHKKLFDEKVEIWVEPGRGLVANAGILVTSVINRTVRDNKLWVYVDTGIFHGVMETSQGFKFPVLTEKDNEPRRECILAGPSCDSVDVFMDGITLPETIDVGDKLFFLSAGAYTTSVEHYNGISYPGELLI